MHTPGLIVLHFRSPTGSHRQEYNPARPEDVTECQQALEMLHLKGYPYTITGLTFEMSSRLLATALLEPE